MKYQVPTTPPPAISTYSRQATAYASVVKNSKIVSDIPKLPISAAMKTFSGSLDLAAISSFAGTLLKWELIRDFFQILSVFFSTNLSINFPSFGVDFFNSILGFLSFNLSSIPIASFKLYVVPFLVLLTIIGFIIFMRQASQKSDASMEGMFSLTDELRSKWWRRSRWITVTILMTLFLPVTQNFLKLLVCVEPFTKDQCNGIGFYHVSTFIGFVLFLIFPIRLNFLVQSSRPVLRSYNTLGQELSKSEQARIYIQDAKSSSNPYKHLFSPFTYKSARYKVFVMFAKFILITPALLIPSPIFSSAVYSFLLFCYLLIAYKTKTFTDSADRFVELCSRLTSFLIAVLGLFSIILPAAAVVCFFICTVLTILNVVFMLIFTVGGTSKGKLLVQNVTKSLYLDRDPETSEPYVLKEGADLSSRRINNIWCDFWTSLFCEYEPFKPDESRKYGYHRAAFSGAPPTLLKFNTEEIKGTVGDRLVECLRIVEEIGPVRYREGIALLQNKELIDNLYGITNGQDVYWNGEFGSAYVIPFPPITVFVSDSAKAGDAEKTFKKRKKTEEIEDTSTGSTVCYLDEPHEFAKFLEEHSKPTIRAGRLLRQKFRALIGKEFYFTIQKTVQVSKTKQEHYTDAEGNRKTRTVHYKVPCNATFNRGRVYVGQTLDQSLDVITEDGRTVGTINPSSGCGFGLSYSDGTGIDSEGDHQSNLSTSIGNEWFQYTSQFVDTHSEMQRFFNIPEVDRQWRENIQNVTNLQAEHRKMMRRQDFDAKNDVLPYSFWADVFTNPQPHSQLVSVLSQSPSLRMIPDTFQSQLEVLYRTMKKTEQKSLCIWYLFWDDVWRKNKANKKFIAAVEILCPTHSESNIPHSIIEKDALIEKLVENNLRYPAPRPFVKHGFFKDSILDQLYDRVNSVGTQSTNTESSISTTEQQKDLKAPLLVNQDLS